MRVYLSYEEMKKIKDENDFIKDGVKWVHVQQEEDYYKNRDLYVEVQIYQRLSDNKYFKIYVAYQVVPYEYVQYVNHIQDNTAYEVYPCTRTEWIIKCN